jgi:hypothetical protein
MNFFQVQDFMKQMYPGKDIQFDFDDKCHRFYELVMTDGVANPVHHCECNKVKVMVEGMDPIYVPIAPHRLAFEHNYMCDVLQSKMVKK